MMTLIIVAVILPVVALAAHLIWGDLDCFYEYGDQRYKLFDPTPRYGGQVMWQRVRAWQLPGLGIWFHTAVGKPFMLDRTGFRKLP